MLGDPELKKCKVGDIIQLQRRGYYRVDNAYAPASPHTGKPSPVILFEIPDGSQKSTTATPASPAKTPTTANATTISPSSSVDDVNEKITKQGNLIRDLKSQKADKAKIDAEVKVLLALKADFKKLTGKDWTPNAGPVKKESTPPPPAASSNDLNDKITQQGNLVRELKTQKADKSKIDAAVKQLLALKAEYKTLTGKEWKPDAHTSNVSILSFSLFLFRGTKVSNVKLQLIMHAIISINNENVPRVFLSVSSSVYAIHNVFEFDSSMCERDN